MGFTGKQIRALGRSVPSHNTKTRVSGGKELIYIEGWYALAQANRIFGFDGWDRETVETKCLQQRESRGHCIAVYSARVRITVRADDAVTIRDGHGTGEAHGESVGEVHDRALKAAETDATKRALATFGKAFGLALYAGRRQSALSKNRAETPKPEGLADVDRSNPSLEVLSSSNVARTSIKDRYSGDSKAAKSAILKAGSQQGQLTGSVDSQLVTAIVDKSALTLPEPRRVRDKEHLRFVASQPCLLCSKVPCDAHHLRFAQPRALGRKVGDDYTVPLCRAHHRNLHDSGNETAWWHDMGIDALEVAKGLWEESLGRGFGSDEQAV